MRLARFVVCLSLLSAAAVAQTPTSSQSGTSGQSNPTDTTLQTGDVNQAVQNPLGSANQTQTPTEKKSQAATFDAGSATTAGQDQVVGEVRMMTGYSEIAGDRTRSFHTPGNNNLGEINYFQDHRFLVTQRLQVLSSFRATDDASIDPERDSLQKAYIRLYGPRDEVIVGDALVNYSRLSFNQNIKGLSTTFKVGDNWKISDVAGVFIDRWGSLYKPFGTQDVPFALDGRPYLVDDRPLVDVQEVKVEDVEADGQVAPDIEMLELFPEGAERALAPYALPSARYQSPGRACGALVAITFTPGAAACSSSQQVASSAS